MAVQQPAPIGVKFNRLTVLEDLGMNKKGSFRLMKCLCECGNVGVFNLYKIKKGTPKSCGCYQSEQRIKTHTKHGHAANRNKGVRSKTYTAWFAMLYRCKNSKCDSYKDYGGRGIEVCKEWEVFENFLADMGEATEGMTLERINVDKGYCRDNCKWATCQEQNWNKRNTRKFFYNGKNLSVPELAKIADMNVNTLESRLRNKNITLEHALSRPLLQGSRLANKTGGDRHVEV